MCELCVNAGDRLTKKVVFFFGILCVFSQKLLDKKKSIGFMEKIIFLCKKLIVRELCRKSFHNKTRRKHAIMNSPKRAMGAFMT